MLHSSQRVSELPSIIELADPRLSEELGYTSRSAVYVARQRGAFPIRVIKRSGTLCVLKADLLKYLGDGVQQTGSAPLIRRAASQKQGVIRKGRPTKLETVQAREKGITVSQLRKEGSAK